MLNLWELMTHAECDKSLTPHKRQQVTEMLTELSSRSVSGQEISIGSTERGWLVKIHSCFSDMEVLVLIPSNPNLPVEVVTDTRKGQ